MIEETKTATLSQAIHSDTSSSQGLIPKSYKYQVSNPINNFLTDLTFGITTRLGLKNLCDFKAFLSMIKLKKGE